MRWRAPATYLAATLPQSDDGQAGDRGFPRLVCGADFTISVVDEVLAGERAAFSVTRTFPDGKRVSEYVIIQTRDSQIRCRVDIDAWD